MTGQGCRKGRVRRRPEVGGVGRAPLFWAKFILPILSIRENKKMCDNRGGEGQGLLDSINTK